MMRRPCFFKMPYMLGKPNRPNKKTDSGASLAPDAILSRNFLSKFTGWFEPLIRYPGKKHEQNFITRDTCDLEALGQFYALMADEIFTTMTFGREEGTLPLTQVVVGGDHSVASPGLAALLRRKWNPQEEVGVVIIDSHGDIHNPKTSPSGNFHGMWLRPHLDTFGVPSIDNYANIKLPTSNILYIGNLDLEQEEKDYMKKEGIIVISRQDFLNNYDRASYLAGEFVGRFDHIHISFDVDAVDKSLAQGTEMPKDGGMTPNDYFALFRAGYLHREISIDVCEVYPALDTKENGAVERSQDVLEALMLS